MTIPQAFYAVFVPMALFAFSTSITPGPNNIMLASSGVNYGFRRTMPHILGIVIGFPLMIFVLGLGAGTLFQQLPWLHQALKVISIVYLLYLAWRVATAGQVNSDEASGKPLTFLQAALFQWVNPKGWTMALGLIAVYVPPTNYFLNLLLGVFAFLVAGLISCSAWSLFGVGLRRYLRQPKFVHAFNISMALLLVLSLYPLLID